MAKLALPIACSILLLGCALPASINSASTPFAQAAGCDALIDPDRSAFVLHEVRSGRTYVCNRERAETRFVPASTFKIPHALIALETRVVEDENQPFPWDGRPRGVAAWDRDTSLAEAVARSTVWVFQSVAERIGHARESAALQRLRYGNMNTGGPDALRSFWLRGPLAINALEQVEFLSLLRSLSLDSDRSSQQRTVAMLKLRECGTSCAVYGKTGAVLPIDDDGVLKSGDESLLPPGEERTGWFVGWVERPLAAGGAVIFAHNLDLKLPGAMPGRTTVVYSILRANGVDLGGE